MGFTKRVCSRKAPRDREKITLGEKSIPRVLARRNTRASIQNTLPRSPTLLLFSSQLVVTDLLGNIFRFATDSTITIETLPKYGRLFVASTAAAAAAAGPTAELKIANGYDRLTGACRSTGGGDHGNPGRRCPDTFGTGPSLSSRTLGAVAARNRVHPGSSSGGEGALGGSLGVPRVWYDPVQDYLGPDDFSFSVAVGGVTSTEAWVVGVHTRRYLGQQKVSMGAGQCKGGLHVELGKMLDIGTTDDMYSLANMERARGVRWGACANCRNTGTRIDRMFAFTVPPGNPNLGIFRADLVVE